MKKYLLKWFAKWFLETINDMECPHCHDRYPGASEDCKKCIFAITIYDEYCLIGALNLEPGATIKPFEIEEKP